MSNLTTLGYFIDLMRDTTVRLHQQQQPQQQHQQQQQQTTLWRPKVANDLFVTFNLVTKVDNLATLRYFIDLMRDTTDRLHQQQQAGVTTII